MTTTQASLSCRAAEISRLHSEIIDSLQTSLDKALRIGELLIEEKARLPHGQFGRWIADNLPFTDRTARNYMRLSRHRERLKSETVSDLGDAYRLLSVSSTEGEIERAIDAAIHALDAGYVPYLDVNLDDVNAMVASWTSECDRLDITYDECLAILNRAMPVARKAALYKLKLAAVVGRLEQDQ